MPVLANNRHEIFAQQIAKGASQRDAYRLAGFKVDNIKAADASASKLLSSSKVADRVAELQTQVAERIVETTGVSKSWIIAKLVENVERAMQATPVYDKKGEPTGEYTYQGNVANRALELIGKEHGMFIDRKEVGRPGDFDAMSDSDLDAFIAEETRQLLAQTKRGATKH